VAISQGSKVKSVYETKAEFKIDFEDGSSTKLCLANPGSSVAVGDKSNALEYRVNLAPLLRLKIRRSHLACSSQTRHQPSSRSSRAIYAKAARSFQPNGEPEPEPVIQRVCNIADGLADKCIQILDKLENAAGHTANDIPISKSRRSAEAKQPMNRPQLAR